MKKRTPKLRFKEFDDAWKETPLGRICQFVNGRAYKQDELLSTGKYRVLRVGNLFNNNEWYYSNLELQNDKYVESDDLIYAWSASFGPRFWKEEKVIYHYHIWKIITNETVVDKNFLFYLLELDVNRLKAVSQGGTMFHITKSTIESRLCLLPRISEQQKIASFLSAVDEKIQQLTRKKELLEKYKKGVMQQLFSGKLRFKDENGKPFPKWGEKRLGEVCEINPSTDELPESFIYVDLESVVKGRLIQENRISKYEAPSRAQRKLQPQDILYQTVRPYQMNNYLFEKKGDYVASTGYAQIRTNQCTKYIYQLLHSEDFVNEVIERCTGTSFPAINSRDLGKIKVPIPHKEEQQKIASYLTALDSKIENVSFQIDNVQKFKKGLLQQMFV